MTTLARSSVKQGSSRNPALSSWMVSQDLTITAYTLWFILQADRPRFTRKTTFTLHSLEHSQNSTKGRHLRTLMNLTRVSPFCFRLSANRGSARSKKLRATGIFGSPVRSGNMDVLIPWTSCSMGIHADPPQISLKSSSTINSLLRHLLRFTISLVLSVRPARRVD